jgi:adenine-specific DNA-methyltransferase
MHRLPPREFARKLRRDSTDAEHALWFHLRDRRLAGLKFRRQHAIGRYTVDFACIACRLVVELDGGQHLKARRYDDARSAFLEARGWRVLRLWDRDVLLQPTAALEAILAAARLSAPESAPA